MSNLLEQRSIASAPTWPLEDIKRADVEVTYAAKAIREYYYRQLPLLRQIPYLALEADGRGGWLDEYSRAYTDCMMAIHQENETWGSYDMFIELRSGVLISTDSTESSYVVTFSETVQFGGETNWNLASDTEIYTRLAHQTNERFDPIKVIEEMQTKAKNPYHNRPEEVEKNLRKKEHYKEELDHMMANLPIEVVLKVLKSQGFDL